MREVRMADLTLEEAAMLRARFELEPERTAEPDEWPADRFERMVGYITENIVSRREDWRQWAASEGGQP